MIHTLSSCKSSTHNLNAYRTIEPCPQSTRAMKKSNTSRFFRYTSICLRFALLAVLWSVSLHAHAAKAPIYTSLFSNKAVGGYDVVSYFQGDGKPLKGKSKYSTKHKGAAWYFSSKENLESFKSEPDKYAPQYGGYCAYAMASGDTVKGDPLQFHIENDKLYLNFNKKFHNIWLGDKVNYISKGDQQWPTALK